MYAENSIRKGRLEDLENYRIGPSAQRPMGASHIPKKSTRTPYSREEDELLYDYVYKRELTAQAKVSGNKIYQEFAEMASTFSSTRVFTSLMFHYQHPQHSWQSWRSRYLRELRGKFRSEVGVPRSELLHQKVSGVLTQVIAQPQPPEQDQTQPTVGGTLPTEPVDSTLKRKRISEPQPSTDLSKPVIVPSSSKRRIIEASGNDNHLAPRPSASHLAQGSQATNTPTQTQNRPQIRDLHSPIFQTSDNTESYQPGPSKSTAKPTVASQDSVDPLFLELPFLPSSPESEDGDELEDELPDVPSWIDSQLARGNANESTIIAVLRAASLKPELAEKVLEHWDPDKGLPDDMPGIWTPEDDKFLEGDARQIRMVFEKHGEKASIRRWQYLSIARERGML